MLAMEMILVGFISATAAIFILLILSTNLRSNTKRLPPGPRGWPLLGNIFDLGALPHIGLAALKDQYGPVVWLKLGSTNTMVILTANAATELFKNHDLSVMDPAIVETMRSHDHHKSSMILAPYSPYWRALRRVCTVEMFTNKRIEATSNIREKCVNDMLLWIEKEAMACPGGGIEVTQYVFPTLFNMLGNLILSRDLVDPQSEIATEFFAAMKVMMECVGTPNVSDLFPWLRWFDLQGLRKKMDHHQGRAMRIISGLVKERVRERHAQFGRDKGKDFLDVLLDFDNNVKDEPATLSELQISVFLKELFIAGTETASTTTEWAMWELLRNPKMMIKTKAELTKVVGLNKKVKERDIDNLHYLQAVVKETLRLHPPAPLLLPRKVSQDINFMGYDIPKNTKVFVNAWAIARDPDYWEDPLTFNPDRFLGLNESADYRGLHFEFIPFGAGRRICAGLPLAHQTAHFILASLLQRFEWVIDDNNISDTFDSNETLGITSRKLNPLKAIPNKPTVNV